MTPGFRIDWPSKADVEAYHQENAVSRFEARRIMDRVALEYAARTARDIDDLQLVVRELIRRIL